MSLKEMLASKGDFYYIPIDNIKEDIVVRADMGDIESLARNIAQSGLEYPLLVRLSEKKHHVLIVDGVRRFRAINLINEKNMAPTGNIYDVMCSLENKGTDEATRYLKLLATSGYSKPLTADESSDIVYKLVHKYNLAVDEIAVRLGQPVYAVQQLLNSKRILLKPIEEKLAKVNALLQSGKGYDGLEGIKKGLELALDHWEM